MVIDKGKLYSRFQKNVDNNQRLQRMVAAKSMDMPWDEDEMNIQANRGITGWQLMGIVGALVAGAVYWHSTQPTTAVQGGPPAVPAAQEYRVTFSAEDGTEIKVEKPR